METAGQPVGSSNSWLWQATRQQCSPADRVCIASFSIPQNRSSSSCIQPAHRSKEALQASFCCKTTVQLKPLLCFLFCAAITVHRLPASSSSHVTPHDAVHDTSSALSQDHCVTIIQPLYSLCATMAQALYSPHATLVQASCSHTTCIVRPM